MKKVLILLFLIVIVSAFAMADLATIWTTDESSVLKLDFAPGDNVYIHGEGFLSDSLINISIVRPDGIVESCNSAWCHVRFINGQETSNSSGNFLIIYDLNGIVGNYTINVNDGTNFLTRTFTDAAIWTTDASCGNNSQDFNHFDIGDMIFINGDGFDLGNYTWTIKGKPGGASCDPNIEVANGTQEVNNTGMFCIDSYTVANDDCGEYQVKFSNKGDNYRVEGVACGDGNLDTGEECDDSNNVGGDGCDSTCALEFCGDSIVNNDNETCDDGNNNDGDGCSSECVIESICSEETLIIEGDDLWDVRAYEYTYLNWDKFNNGGSGSFQVGTSTSSNNAKTRTYFKSILDSIPDNSTILDASLQIYFYSSHDGSIYNVCDFMISVNRVISGNWTEGTKVGALAVWPEISWFNQQFLTLSTTEKVVFDPTPVVYNYINITEFVQNWYDGIWDNYGFVMKRDVEGANIHCNYNSVSKEYINPDPVWETRKPKLNVTYVPEECVNEPVCGDNVTNDGEQCDDGNNISIDGCSTCQLTYCGDGILQSLNGNNQTEQCESDGECSAGEVCNSCLCELGPYCGDSIIQQSNTNGFNESCDDGANGNFTDECNDDCTLTFCGDGSIQTPNGYNQTEVCETGDERICITDTGYNGIEICNISGQDHPVCQYRPCESEEYCGDGILQEPHEECDDSNTEDGDGCSSLCTLEGGSLSIMNSNLFYLLGIIVLVMGIWRKV